MSKTCKNCGNTFEDHMNICPRCGMQYVADTMAQSAAQYPNSQPNNGAAGSVQNPNQYPQPNYTQPSYQQSYTQPTYPAYSNVPPSEQMTVGNWIATILLTQCLGVISLVLLFVWGFGDNVPMAKKNYCRAMLIFEAIAVGLVIIMVILMIAAGESIFDKLDQYSSSYYA